LRNLKREPELLVRSILNGGLAACNKALSPIEHLVVARKRDLPFPPVFIIGSPRSGSTLLYQVLVARYRFAYFTNFTSRFYCAPTVASWLAHKLFPPPPVSDYTSRYGQTTGWHGPHECGAFWYRWFLRGEYVYVIPGVTPVAHLKELRREVTGMSSVARAPVLFKNTYNSMRIAPITEALPEACFLVCQRDFVDTAQSILNGRKKLYGDKERWMGVQPKEIGEIRTHPYWQQVVEQVYYVYQQIEKDKRRSGADRFFDVHYSQLCREPWRVLADIEEFLEGRGLKLYIHGDLPSQFPISTGQKVNRDDYERIVQKVNELWG